MTACIMKSSYSSYYQYRKAVRSCRDRGWIVRNIEGGVICFEFIHDYEVWKRE